MQNDTINQFGDLLSKLAEQGSYNEAEKKKFANLAMNLTKIKEQTEKQHADMQLVLKSLDEIGNKKLCHYAYEMYFQLSEELGILEWCLECIERITTDEV